jgi:hypothetical protein
VKFTQAKFARGSVYRDPFRIQTLIVPALNDNLEDKIKSYSFSTSRTLPCESVAIFLLISEAFRGLGELKMSSSSCFNK